MRQAALLLLVCSLWSSPALAYQRSTSQESGVAVSWRHTSCVRLRPDRSRTNHVQDGTEQEVIERSARAWETATASCSYLRFVVEEPALLPEPRPEGQLREDVAILWIDRDWEDLTGGAADTVALTQVRYIDEPGDPSDGEILDADLQVNAQTYRFTIAGSPGTVNALTTVTHELGHVLGLDHPCEDGGLGEMIDRQAPSCGLGDFGQDVMYPSTALGTARPRVPSADETRGICTIYPLASSPGTCPSPPRSDAGCQLSGRGLSSSLSPLSLLLLVLALLLARVPRMWRPA